MAIFKTKKNLQLERKFIHVVFALIVALDFAYFFHRKNLFIFVSICFLFCVAVETLRLRSSSFNRWVFKLGGAVLRIYEKRQLSGSFYYLLGVLFCLSLPKTLAIHSLLVLAFFDPIASLVGLSVGRTKWAHFLGNRVFPGRKLFAQDLYEKSVEGSLAGFFAALIVGIIAWTGPWASSPLIEGGNYWPNPLEVVFFSFFGACFALFAEIWPSQWDDNLRIPLWVGALLFLLVQIIGIPLRYL